MPERFIKPLLLEAAIAMSLWILFWIIFNMSKKGKDFTIPLRIEIKYFLFYVYLIGVLSLTIIPLPFKRFRQPNEFGINIVPFANTYKGLVELEHAPWLSIDSNFQNIIGNIILFLPLGMFLPWLSNKYRSIRKVVIFSCFCSMSIELTQLISRHFEIYRTVDIDDVILNTSGAMVGYLLFALINKWHFHKDTGIKKTE